MSESVNGRLSRAFELIEADQLKEARDILEPMLSSQDNNPDVWWLYAHAVEDIAPAEEALQRVIALQPNYPGAEDLAASIESLKNSKSSLGGTLDDLDIDAFLIDEVAEESIAGDSKRDGKMFSSLSEESDDTDVDNEPSTYRQILARLAIPALVVALLVLVFVVFNPFGEEEDDADRTATATLAAQAEEPTVIIAIDTAPVPSEVAGLPTATPEDVIMPVTPENELSPTTPAEVTDPPISLTEPGSVAGVTDSSPETTPSDPQGLVQLEIALSDAGLDVVPGSSRIEDTNLGTTALVSVCSELGPALRDAFPAALQAVASESADLEGRVDSIGVSFLDCGEENLLNTLGVDLLSALAFSEGNITADTFRALWRPIQ